MFDIKKFLAENTVQLTEDDELKKLAKALEFAKAVARDDFGEYLKRAGMREKRHVMNSMAKYEAAVKALEDRWKREKGKNYNVGRGR